MRGKRFVKGYKFDRAKIAQTFKLSGASDNDVDDVIHTAVSMLNRQGFLYLACAYDDKPGVDWTLCNVIVLDEGTDPKALHEKPLVEDQVDETILWARPHVLDGPGVWELS